MDAGGDLWGNLVECDAGLLGGTYELADQSMTFAERHAGVHEQIGEIGGAHRRIESGRHALWVDGEGVDRAGDGWQHGRERIDRIEQQRLVFLQILLISRRNSLQCRQ